jgi:hypothetical protein
VRTLETRPQSRWKRDVGMALRLVAMLAGYFTLGARVRRAYRAAAGRGETLWLDAHDEIRHREAPLRR